MPLRCYEREVSYLRSLPHQGEFRLAEQDKLAPYDFDEGTLCRSGGREKRGHGIVPVRACLFRKGYFFEQSYEFLPNRVDLSP